MKKVIITLNLLSFSFLGSAQIFIENFLNAGTTLVSNGWAASSGTGTNNLSVNNAGLTYSNSPVSGIGYGCNFQSSGEDVVKAFSSTFTSGSVYASFLINMSTVQTGDYFAGIFSSNSGTSTPAFSLRVYARSTTNGYFFGISKGSGTISYESTLTRSTSVTYLVVIKYTFNTANTSDDVVSLWVNPTLGATEGVPTISTSAGTDASNPISGFFIRQGSALSSPSGEIDGIQGDGSWALVPVTLLNFLASTTHGHNKLVWSTASEQNNSGFAIERSTNGTDFENIGFVKSFSSNGNSSSRLDYSFTDFNPIGLNQYYRLKQTDFDGTRKYSAIVMVRREVPTALTLTKVYPNPANGSIYINASVPTKMDLQFLIIDVAGRVVSTKNAFADVGNNGFDMTVEHLESGTYFIKAISKEQGVVATEKFIKF